MLRRMRTIVAMAGVSLMLVSSASAQERSESSGADVQDQLRTLLDEVKGLRADNESMRGEIDELRASTRDDWLTERRADEIRGIVQDVLADADTRASFQTDGLVAGWSDHFFLASPDGRFKLNIGGQLQTRWVFNFHDESDRYRMGFENSRTKLLFSGHVINPDWTFMVETNFARDGGGSTLEDAWIRHDLNNDMSFRVGQFRLPFSREYLVNSAYQLAVERSLIDSTMNIGRSQGFELTFSDSVSRFIVAYSDGGENSVGEEAGFNLAGVGSDPANSPALVRDTEYAVTGRYELLLAGRWEQFKDFTSPYGDEKGILIGAAVHSQQQEYGEPGPRGIRWLAWTADVSVEFGGANAFASFTHHYYDGPTYFGNVYGLVAQAGIYLTPKWEMYARGEYGWTDFDLAGPSSVERSDFGLVTFGANYYIDGQDMKWSSDIGFGITQIEDIWTVSLPGYRTDAEDAEPQIVIRTQLQLLF